MILSIYSKKVSFKTIAILSTNKLSQIYEVKKLCLYLLVSYNICYFYI